MEVKQVRPRVFVYLALFFCIEIIGWWFWSFIHMFDLKPAVFPIQYFAGLPVVVFLLIEFTLRYFEKRNRVATQQQKNENAPLIVQSSSIQEEQSNISWNGASLLIKIAIFFLAIVGYFVYYLFKYLL